MRLTFDRGTLVLEDVNDGDLARKLPGFAWDPRVQRLRAPARSYGLLRRELSALGVAFEDEIEAAVQKPDRWSDVDLRPYQDAAHAAWELAECTGLIVLPTGSGKTRVALATMARTGLSALCLVPTRVLLEQWLAQIRALYPGRVGCFGDGERDLAPITVATFESAYRHMGTLGDRFDLLIADEVHHFGGGMRDEALEMSTARARLGLTATPPQGLAAGRLIELVGPTVYQLNIADLAGSFLAEFETLTLHLDLTPRERRCYEDTLAILQAVRDPFRKRFPEASFSDFLRAATRTPEGRRALEAWREARALLAYTTAKDEVLRSLLSRHRESRLLVFTADNATAYAVSRRHLLMPLTCDIGRSEREQVLQRFRDGSLRALVSARVLNEGLDVPDADVAIVLGGTLGEREHVQRIGRLLRPAAGKRAMVYELVAAHTLEVSQARRRGRGLAASAAAFV